MGCTEWKSAHRKGPGAGSKCDGGEQGWEVSEALFSFEMH